MNKSVTLLPAWTNAANAIADGSYTYGDMVAYDELFLLMGRPKPDAKASAAEQRDFDLWKLQQFDELKKHLLFEHRMFLRAEAGIGFRIVMPQDQTRVSEGIARAEITRSLRDLGSRLAHVDRSQLTSEQQRENTDAQVRLASKIQAIRQIDRLHRIASEPQS